MKSLQKASYFALLWILGSAWVVWTGFKSAPVILSDEWTYRSQIAFLRPEEYSIPNYLYSWVYGLSNLFENFYLVTQILNLLFFMAFCLVVYFSTRLFTDFWPAALLSMGVLVSPLGLFVGLQMPEAPYYFLVSLGLFALLKALFFSETSKHYLMLLVASALTLLAASFVKPHALFFLIGSLLSAILFRPKGFVTLKRAIAMSAVIAVFWFGLKLGIGSLVGGRKGFAIFGEGYERALFEQLFGLNLPTKNLASGLLVAVASQPNIDWVPLIGNFAILFAVFFGAYLISRSQLEPNNERPFLFILSLVAFVSAMILAFQVFITLNGDTHTDRVLLRHFEFAIPLLIATLLAKRSSFNRLSSAHLVLFITILAALLLFPIMPYSPNLSDSSFLYSFTGNRLVFVILIGLALLFWLYAKNSIWVASGFLVISFLGSALAQPLLAFRNEVSQIEQTVDAYENLRSGGSIPEILSYRKQDAASFLFLLNRGLGSYTVLGNPADLIDIQGTDRSKDLMIIGNQGVFGKVDFVTLAAGYSRLYPASGTRLEGQSAFPSLLQVASIEPVPPQNGFGPVIRENSIVRLQSPLNPGERLKLSLVGHSESYGGETLFISLGGEQISLAIPKFTQLQEFYLVFPNSKSSDMLQFDFNGKKFEFTIAEISKVEG